MLAVVLSGWQFVRRLSVSWQDDGGDYLYVYVYVYAIEDGYTIQLARRPVVLAAAEGAVHLFRTRRRRPVTAI